MKLDKNEFFLTLKITAYVVSIIFFLLGTSYMLTEIERSNINELRYCPHCSEKLFK